MSRIVIKSYVKKPITVSAMLITQENIHNFENWTKDIGVDLYNNVLYISTLEGVMRGNVGDYVIKGISGEYYPCKADIFHKTYKQVK